MGSQIRSSACPLNAVGRRRGRPRSEASRLAVLQAAAQLLDVDRITFDALSVESIAARAGVGKQTIYRWWPNKAAVVLDALIDGHLAMQFPPVPDTGDLSADLRAWMDTMLEEAFTESLVSMARQLIAAIATGSSAVQERFRASEICENLQLQRRLAEEVGRGGLRPGSDPYVLTAALMDPILLRMLTIGKPDREWAHALLDTVLDGALDATPAA